MELKIESDKLRNRIEYSRKQIGLTEDKLRQALSMSLRLNEAPEIQSKEQDPGSPPSFWFPADHPSLANNTEWIATIDTLRECRKTGEKYGEWRRRSIIREITFEDTGKLGDKAVHFHLEHQVVKRLLGQFTAQGLIHHDLSKACLTAATEAIPRVILLGRLAIYGPHASRLHEEIIPVTARWVDPSMRTSPIVPYQKSAEQTTLDSLERALDEAGRYTVSDRISDRLLASTNIDIESLLPHLESRADESLQVAKGRLIQRAQRERRTMIEL